MVENFGAKISGVDGDGDEAAADPMAKLVADIQKGNNIARKHGREAQRDPGDARPRRASRRSTPR